MLSKVQAAIRLLNTSVKVAAACAVLTGPLWAGQSLRLNGSQTASNGSVAAQPINGACRLEFQLSFTTNPSTGHIAHVNACDFTIYSDGGYLGLWSTTLTGWPCCGQGIQFVNYSSNWMVVRFQQIPSGAGGTLTWEAWDINGVRQFSHSETYGGTTGSHSNGANVGSVGSQDSSWGFFRLYNTTVPVGSAEPTFADSGNLLEWKFNNGLADVSGRGYTASSSAGTPANPCGSAPCYETTAGQSLVTAVIKTNPAPTWSNWQSWRAGTTVGLDGSASISMGDSSSTPTLLWQILSGPSTPVWSSRTAVRPTLRGIVFGNYRVQLVATNSSGGTATAIQDIGAVAFDDNGVVIPADPKVSDIFGPQIAFGQNPWAWEDERNLKAMLSQPAYQAAAYDTTWFTPGQGTVSYPFGGKGFQPGPSCTTLSSGISATDTSISVADARCLTMTSLPTWILVGTFAFGGGPFEMIRIDTCTSVATGTACTSGTVAATLHVAYDGRGMSGNLVALGGYANTVPARAWSSGTNVGEFRIQGTGTLFSSDPNRPVCPAGIPGPPGLVTNSSGTVTLTAGSTTVAGSGTNWNSASGVFVGGFIRVAATHASGTGFVFWGQIVTVTDATHLVLNRPAPAGVDGTAFSYKITSPAMYLSLEFPAPGDGHTVRGLFNGIGCESETAMFALFTHDIPQLDSTIVSGLKYSYKVSLGLYSSAGTTTSDFYGVGVAARNFYYRSGYGPALTLANLIDENSVRDPEIGDGFFGSAPLATGGIGIGAMLDLALNSSTALTWANVEQFARSGEMGGLACNVTDTREGAYRTAWLTLAAHYDTNSTNRAAFKTSLSAVLARDQNCKRNVSDGYSGAEVNSFSNSFVYNPIGSGTTQPLTLTNGSTAVTGSGFSNGGGSGGPYCYGRDIITLTVTNGSSTARVASGTLTQQSLIYFYDGSRVGVYEYLGAGTTGATVQLAGKWLGASGTYGAMSTAGGAIVSGGQREGGFGAILAETAPTSEGSVIDNLANNKALEHIWACKFNSSSSLTLFRSWDGTNTSALTGGSNYYISYYNIGAFGQQPFMFGVKTNMMNWASKNDDTTIAATAASILPLMGEWYNSYGWDANNFHGTYYDTVVDACGSQADVPAGSFDSIHAFSGCGPSGTTAFGISTARVNSVEGGSAMIQYYLANPTPARQAIVDRFYGAVFGLTSFCAASVLATCDGFVASNLTDAEMGSFKWPGFFFGMGGFFANSWPAVRQGGALPAVPRTLNVTCNISDVANATKCRVTLTMPNGTTATNTCTVSPCSVTGDARQGDLLLEVDYLSASDMVLALGTPQPVRVN